MGILDRNGLKGLLLKIYHIFVTIKNTHSDVFYKRKCSLKFRRRLAILQEKDSILVIFLYI